MSSYVLPIKVNVPTIRVSKKKNTNFKNPNVFYDVRSLEDIVSRFDENERRLKSEM